MEISEKEQKRAERILRNIGIELHRIDSFSFMKRYRPKSGSGNRSMKKNYGPGILTLHLQGGTDIILNVTHCNHPSSFIRYLISEGIPLDNYTPLKRTTAEAPTVTYNRPSLYMLYFFALLVASLILGSYFLSLSAWWRFIPAIIFYGLGIYLLNMLITRFCYLTLDNVAMTVHSVGRSIRYTYDELRKVNFDFARESAFTHIMEVLDKDYRYRLYYIGRVSRKKLNEIAERLKQAGVDATCSLDDNKRFYKDVRH